MGNQKMQKTFQSIREFDDAIKNFPSPVIGDLFQQPKRGGIADRFSVYATGYDVRSRDAMEEMYSVLPKVIGEEPWLRLGALYTKVFPSRSHNLSTLGKRLPEFMRDQSYAVGHCDMAELELQVSNVFHSPRSAALTGDDFSKLSEQSRFEFCPSTVLFSSKFNCISVWKSLGDLRLAEIPEYGVLYRKNFSVGLNRISESEFKTLERIASGSNLGAAIDDVETEIESEDLSQWLRFWLDCNYFSKIYFES